jgi:TPR repeat protein
MAFIPACALERRAGHGVERMTPTGAAFPGKIKGAAKMAFTDMEIAEAHAAARTTAAQSEDLYKLGLIYSTGQSGAVDLVQAHMWFNLAAVRGSDAAKECRREIADQLSKDEVATAQKRAREWLAKGVH